MSEADRMREADPMSETDEGQAWAPRCSICILMDGRKNSVTVSLPIVTDTFPFFKTNSGTTRPRDRSVSTSKHLPVAVF
jgi:hypothetical protein